MALRFLVCGLILVSVAARSLLEHTNQYVRTTKPDIHSRELIDVIFTQPYCRIANLVEAVDAWIAHYIIINDNHPDHIGREYLNPAFTDCCLFWT